MDYALLEHAAPRRILLIGGGVNGAVAEALKHPTVERLDYVELDPALIGMAREFFPAQTAAFDSDSRVHLHFLDGRRFLTETGEKFDVIIVDVPDPQTAQLNRFYTVEFFLRGARASEAGRAAGAGAALLRGDDQPGFGRLFALHPADARRSVSVSGCDSGRDDSLFRRHARRMRSRAIRRCWSSGCGSGA